MSIAPHPAAVLAAAALIGPAWAQDSRPSIPHAGPNPPAAMALQPEAGDSHAGHGHGLPSDPDGHTFTPLPVPLGADLLERWFDGWPHAHYSPRGTPRVHPFSNEPAFLGRDLLLDYSLRHGGEGSEAEVTAELEYALTRRIGLVAELPYVLLDPESGPREGGVGDAAVAGRFLLLEYEEFLLSANLEVSFPTGDSEKGLGAGEAAVNPSASGWVDLGSDFTFQTNVGIEHGLRTDSDTLAWGGAITYSVYLGRRPEVVGPDGAVRVHFPAGLLNLVAEIRGEHPLDGGRKNSGAAEFILGASYSVAPHLEVRAALVVPAWSPRDFDRGFVLGVIVHF